MDPRLRGDDEQESALGTPPPTLDEVRDATRAAIEHPLQRQTTKGNTGQAGSNGNMDPGFRRDDGTAKCIASVDPGVPQMPSAQAPCALPSPGRQMRGNRAP